MRVFGIVGIVGILVACGGSDSKSQPSASVTGVPIENREPTEHTPTEQNAFDFTFVKDREQFEAIDLVYVESIGPYAVYEVTGPDPHLLGPTVTWASERGNRGMLCGAAGYFQSGTTAHGTRLSVIDADSGRELVSTRMQALRMGECAPASDSFGEDIPADPDPDDPDDNDDGGEGGEGPDIPGDMVPRSAKLDVRPELAPTAGSLFLLRRVAVGVEPNGHNGSHVIPKICCDVPGCGLEAPPPPDEPEIR